MQVAKQLFPEQLNLSVRLPGQTTAIELNFKQIDLLDRLNFSYQIPEDSKRLTHDFEKSNSVIALCDPYTLGPRGIGPKSASEGIRTTTFRDFKEIESINALCLTQKTKDQPLTQVQSLTKRSKAENAIRLTNQQANYLTREIISNLNTIDQLQEELKDLKEDYAEMIRQSYKSKSQQSRLMFILSSENFLQAYKRLQYMKQYSQFRRTQGLEIEERKKALRELNELLLRQKAEKEKLVQESRLAKMRLDQERKDQDLLLSELKRDERTYTAQIQDRQREARRIEKEIDRLIKEAIVAANKARGKAQRSPLSN